MTRALDASQDELKRRSHLAPLFLVKFTTYSDRANLTVDTTFYLSDRGIVYDYANTGTDRTFWPLVKDIGALRWTMNHLPGIEQQSLIAKPLEIRLSNETWEGARLITTLRAHVLEGAGIEVAQLLRPVAPDKGMVDLSALTGDEHTVLYRGRVSRVGPVTETEIALQCESETPELLWLRSLDATITDPKDVGVRFPVVYGHALRVPIINYDVGFVTTLAEKIDENQTGTIEVTDTAGFQSSGNGRIGGEEIAWTGKSATTLTGVSRGQSSTKKAPHSAGEQIVEIITTATFIVAGHEVDAINEVYALNPFNGELTRITTAFTKTANDTTTISGKTVASISFTAAEMRAAVNEMAAAAEVTTQPAVSHSVISSLNQQATSGPSELRDGNIATTLFVGSGSQDRTMGFPNLASSYISVTYDVYVVSTSNTFTIHAGDSSNDPTFGTLIGGAQEGWYSFSVSNPSERNQVTLHSFPFSSVVAEVERTVFYNAGNPVVSPAAIEAASVGFGLRLFADIDGYKAPSASYDAGSGNLMTKPADILKHWIEENGGGTADATSYAAALTNLGSDVFAFDARTLGADWRSVASRIASEMGANLIPEETTSGTVWKMLTAESDYEWPAASLSITDWRPESFAEADRELTRELASVFVARYAFDASLGTNEEAFKAALRASPVSGEHDLSDPSLGEMQTAQNRFGDKEAPDFFFLCIQDADTAKSRFGYFVHESIRLAGTFAVPGIPWWEAYDMEIGDLRNLTPPWSSSSLKVRVVEYTKEPATERVEIRAVEVS